MENKETREMVLVDYNIQFKEDNINFCGIFKNEDSFRNYATRAVNFSSAPIKYKINSLKKVNAHFINDEYVNCTPI